MKLLFDQNLSRHLVESLADLFPESRHLSEVGLQAADDRTVWDYARQHGFTIVSKDADFHQYSFVEGHPPKVIWIRRGNCTTQDIFEVLTACSPEIESFAKDDSSSFLALD